MFFISNKLFCNLQEKCLEQNESCNDFKQSENVLENNNIESIINSSSYGFKIAMDKTKEVINKNLDNSIKFLDKKLKKMNYNLLRYNNKFIKIGESYVENIFEESPHEELKNRILSYNDFIKKQDYIIKFCNHFTREPINDEDIYWLYCIDTNKKLIPSFFKILALSYYNGDYNYVLDEICAQRGTISDDGNNWVDKYSGYIIKNIEFNSEEGYNEEGFKLQTRDIIDAEYAFETPKMKYNSEASQTIYNITSSISTFIGLNLESHYDFIIKN